MGERERFERHIQAIEQRKPILWSTVFANSVGRDPFPPHLEGQYFIKDDQKAWLAWQEAARQERETIAAMFDDSPNAEEFRQNIAAAIRSRSSEG